MLKPVDQRQFIDQAVTLDGAFFGLCCFSGCALHYNGGETGMAGCVISGCAYFMNGARVDWASLAIAAGIDAAQQPLPSEYV